MCLNTYYSMYLTLSIKIWGQACIVGFIEIDKANYAGLTPN